MLTHHAHKAANSGKSNSNFNNQSVLIGVVRKQNKILVRLNFTPISPCPTPMEVQAPVLAVGVKKPLMCASETLSVVDPVFACSFLVISPTNRGCFLKPCFRLDINSCKLMRHKAIQRTPTRCSRIFVTSIPSFWLIVTIPKFMSIALNKSGLTTSP